jgi:hypothetical protein
VAAAASARSSWSISDAAAETRQCGASRALPCAREFSGVKLATVPRVVKHTADELNRLLRTASFYWRLSRDQRHALETEHVALYEQLGRPIRSAMVAVVITARRATDI